MTVSNIGISIPAPLSATTVKLSCAVVPGIGAESSVTVLTAVAGSESTTAELMLLLEAGADSTTDTACCSGIADFDHQKLRVCIMRWEESTLGANFECCSKTE